MKKSPIPDPSPNERTHLEMNYEGGKRVGERFFLDRSG
jgi:hypothetical protein